jgi:hypothetical protein
MSKSKLTLIISLILAISYVAWRSYFRPTPIGIMAIDPSSLSYGDTTISGTLQKDSPVGQPGTYILIMSDMQVVVLYNISGVDSLLSKQVTVTGLLTAPSSTSAAMAMTVKSIIIAN